MANERLKGKTLKVTGFLEELEKDAIKDKVDIVELFEKYRVELVKKGKNYIALCPWHHDKNASLSVDREKGLYNCFGCGESGDVFTLVEKMEGFTFKEALKFLQQRVGASQAYPKMPETHDQAPRLRSAQDKQEPPVSKQEKQAPLNNESGGGGKPPEDRTKTADGEEPVNHNITLDVVADFYHKVVFASQEAQEYLKKRGLYQPELITRFKIGCAVKTGTGSGVLDMVSNGQREALKVIGIVRENGVEHFAGCITFPIFDEHDQALSLYGRRAGDTEPKHLYLSGPHKGVWNRKVSKVYDEIILTESIIDALSLVVFGFENVQALYGTNGFTDEHLQTLKDDRVKTVVLAFDADEPGRKAAGKLKEKLLAEDFTVKTIEPSKGKDWNEFLCAGGTKDEITALIAAAPVVAPAEPAAADFTVRREGGIYNFKINQISYQVIGVKELFVQDLRVNIKAEALGADPFYDKLDLYSARSRNAYSANLAALFGVEQKRIERDLNRMLDYLQKERNRALSGKPEKKEMTAEEIEMGMKFLQSPDLFDELVGDMETLGYVGEDLNKKLIYLAASSRLLDDPISILIISQASAGKSLLVETMERLLPEEEVLSITSLSDQALNYVPAIMHKFLVLGEAVHNEIIEHQIRDMLSRKELSRYVVMKDAKTGELGSVQMKTPTVVSCVLSTTRGNSGNPENLSRFFLVNADETREQTKKIHEAQRERDRLATVIARKTDVPEIIKKHQAAQRLLKKLVVVNEYAPLIDFPDLLVRVRRDHLRFLNLIKAVCFLRQYQKVVKHDSGFDYIECDIEDYRIAYEIMVKGVLSATLLELPRSAVELYEALRELARELARKNAVKVNEVSFTQREVRETTRYGQSWIRENMRKLVEYEYILPVSGKNRGERWAYRLKADEEIAEVNLSMIPDPDEIAKRLNLKSEQSEHD